MTAGKLSLYLEKVSLDLEKEKEIYIVQEFCAYVITGRNIWPCQLGHINADPKENWNGLARNKFISKIRMDQSVKIKLDQRRIRNVKIARGITKWCCLSLILFNSMNYKHVHILSDFLQWTISIFRRTSYNELRVYPYSFGRLTMNYTHILSDVWRWTIPIFCRTSDDELYPYSIGRLTMNYIHILSDVLQWTISIFRRTSYNELYPYSVGRLTMNYIHILSDVLQWTIPIFCRTSYNELYPYSVGRLTMNCMHILSDVL